MKNKFTRLALASAIGGMLALSGATSASAAELRLSAVQPTVAGELAGDTDGIYIVRLAQPPVALYDGGIAGFQPTSAQATGKKRLDTESKAAKKYAQFLREQQKEVLGNAGKAFGRAVEAKSSFQFAYNGFAARLTVAEAKALREMEGVVSVQRERIERLTTDSGPNWIGAPSIWNNKPQGTRGEGVVVAILDSGINSDHPSFADIGGDGYDHANPLGSGNYVPGSYCDAVDPGFCNDKLIGAWDFNGTDGPNPEDDDGHGSHTASTAAGNVVLGAPLDAPTTSAYFDISGVAPHANIIAYDVCHWTPSGGSCPGSALMAAIDQVLVDAGNLPNGIAALNYSISGGGDPYNDYVELGFLAAVQAGIYVAASAGNSGPAASTVAHLGPWTSTTAASTHDRAIVNSLVELDSDGGSLDDIEGASVSTGYGPAPVVYAGDYPTANGTSNDTQPEQCLAPFPAGHFNGEIVVCDRGTIARVEKGVNVLAGGAGGMVLANTAADGESVTADAHFLPAIHVGASDGAVLKAWLAANANTAGTITESAIVYDAALGDVMAGFSSRGPQLKFDVLKPDLTAPGVNIMGADADLFGQYQIISGTSMSSPHNAGAGALMTAMRPDLTPQEIKSALMLTASTEFTVKEDGVTPTDPFDLGAGRIDLHAAKSAGLVMSETTANFFFADPALGGDPGTLNVASMMNSNCVGVCSWTRTVTNAEGNSAHWNVTASGDGFLASAEVAPQADSSANNLKLKKGQDGTVTVTVDTTFSEEGWHFGSVDLDRNLGPGPDLSMPIAVKASRATNASLFTKTVDAASAAPGDTLSYELSITNGPLTGPITVTDAVPEGTTFVPGSATEVVTNGSTSAPWAYDDGSNTLTWEGELQPGGLNVSASPAPAGYLSLSNFGIAPRACPSNCDDGGLIFNVPAFTYNGNTYTQLILSVNGTVEAGISSGQASGGLNRDMPAANLPNNLIAPYWRDLDLGAGGNWYIGVLAGGGFQYIVLEWKNVPYYGSSDAATFQVWIETNVSPTPGDIHFVYGRVDDANGDYTIGAENADASNGYSWYYNGSGTPAAVGADLLVRTLSGGTATLGFQVTTDGCANVVNEGELSSGAGTERAIATTTCE